jgi:hypothetical protein
VRVLEASFVRRRGSRDRVYVTRSDGTTTGWDFPSYGDGLPHDLCHLVVEEALGLSEGFWGLVDRHVEVGLVNNAPTLMRDGRPLVEQPGIDFSGLTRAEQMVAVLGAPAMEVEEVSDVVVVQLSSSSESAVSVDDLGERLGFALPETTTPGTIAAIHDRLRDLGRRWRTLDDGCAIKLGFSVGRS